MHASADAGILALGIFAHDYPIELRTVHLSQRADDPQQRARRTDIGVLVERLADCEAHAPEADVIGHVGQPTAPK